jgi:hypothetical protein
MSDHVQSAPAGLVRRTLRWGNEMPATPHSFKRFAWIMAAWGALFIVAAVNQNAEAAGMPLVVLLLGLHFIPTLVALARNHHNTLAIFVLNLLAGWTLIGWLVAMVWACTATRVKQI